jgi:hypothetical protein
VGIRANNGLDHDAMVDFDPYKVNEVRRLIAVWIAVSFAANCLNRSMGQPDLYPFVPSDQVIDKLAFINSIIHSSSQ